MNTTTLPLPATRPRLRRAFRSVRRHPMLYAGGAILIILAAIALAAPWLATVDPQEINPLARMKPPSAEHLFGTDALGRDVYSRTVWGARISLLVGIVVFAVSKDKKRWTARMLANGALCIALSTVLSFITLYKMPQGGSITLASMLPMFLFAYAYGVGPGMLVGAAYGFVQFLQGGLYFVHPVELLLDYPLAFAMLGLAGLSNKFSDQWGMIPGIILGTFGRFVCAFLSGLIFFGMYAPEGQNVVIYSMVYNGLYLVPEAIICIVLAMIPQIRQLAKRLALQD